MNQKAIGVDMSDIVTRAYGSLIFLEKRSTGKSLGSAKVIVLDGGYSRLVRVKYKGLEETTTTNAGQGEDAARRLAFRYHNQANQ